MRLLPLMTVTVALLGCGSSFAQTYPFMRPRTPSMPMMSGMPQATMPTTIPMPATTPLGAIPSALGTPATIAPPAPGTVTTCLMIGPGMQAPSTVLDASSAVGLSGAAPTQIPPGATAPPNLSFAPSISNGACNPAVNSQNASEILGNTTVTTIPGLATITGSEYSDATVPSTSTEVGGDGLSPEIVIPTPDSSAGPTPDSSAQP